MRAGRLRHDGNPCSRGASVRWSARRPGVRILYPTKARPDQKIDAAVARAMGRAMVEDEQAKGLTISSNPIFG